MQKVRELRKAAELSQADLATLSRVSQTAISAIERGTMVPSIDIAKRIADALHVSLNDLLDAPADQTA